MNSRKTHDFFLSGFEKQVITIYGNKSHNWIVARFAEFLSSPDPSITARIN